MYAGARERPSLGHYVTWRVGQGSQWSQLWNLLVRPFGARSFSAFWRQWNPLYGYYLYYWCYKPLSRHIARPVAELVTFAASGFFLHDVLIFAATRRIFPPFITIWFVLMGAIAIAADALRTDLGRLPFAVRVAANVTYLASTFALVLLLEARIASW